MLDPATSTPARTSAATSAPEITARPTADADRIPGVPPCGMGGAEGCPPDAAWAPSAEFGGGAGAGFAIRNRIVIGGGLTLAEGFTQSQVRWGISPSVTDLSVPLNTATFKLRGLPNCDSTRTSSDLFVSAPCAPGADLVYVPSATFEDEVYVPNPGCLLPRRT
jgi:hypothetical protein